MRGWFYSFIALAFVSGSSVNAHTNILERTQSLPIPRGNEFPITVEKLDLRLYASGTVLYQGKTLPWFVGTADTIDVVAVEFLTSERLQRSTDLGADFPIVLEFLYGDSMVTSYFILGSPLCTCKSLSDVSCDYRRFAEDIATRLSRVPEFSNVCIVKIAGVDLGDSIPCSPKK